MPARWLALTCDIVRRNLSSEEWLVHIGEGFDYERTCRDYRAGDGWPLAELGVPANASLGWIRLL